MQSRHVLQTSDALGAAPSQLGPDALVLVSDRPHDRRHQLPAEQAIRPAVVNRKVWGGNRTWAGAWAQSVLTSVLVTLGQRGQQAVEWFSAARRSLVPLPLPP